MDSLLETREWLKERNTASAVHEEDSSSQRDKISVSEITYLKRNRIEIAFSDNSKVILEQKILDSESISIGDVYSFKKIEQLNILSERISAKKYAYSLISRQRLTKKKMQDKLAKIGIRKMIIAELLNELESFHLIDDFEYAKDWISIRIKNHPEGRGNLYVGLLKKGIDKNTINSVLSELFSIDIELITAKECIDRYAKKSLAGRELYSFLQKRGFSGNVIRKLLKNNSESDQ
jgi:regulatory protein